MDDVFLCWTSWSRSWICGGDLSVIGSRGWNVSTEDASLSYSALRVDEAAAVSLPPVRSDKLKYLCGWCGCGSEIRS